MHITAGANLFRSISSFINDSGRSGAFITLRRYVYFAWLLRGASDASKKYINFAVGELLIYRVYQLG